MSLLIHSFDYPPNDGGIARLCFHISRELTRQGLPVRVLTQRGGRPGHGTAESIHETRITARRPTREWGALRHLATKSCCDSVLCGIWYPEGLLAMVARRHPTAVLAHGAELLPRASGPLLAGAWSWLQRRVLASANVVIANSRYTRELVNAASPRANVATILPGVDHESFCPGDTEAAKRELGVQGKRVISSVSRVHAYKGHAVVFEALAALSFQERESIVYLIAGRGPDRPALENRTAELGVAGQVRWLGYVSDERLLQLYRATDLFVLCTRNSAARQEIEGFGMVFLEAQACAVPVIGARTGGIPDAIEPDNGGWLIDDGDACGLAHLLSELVREPGRFRQAGALARRRVEARFTWEHYCRQLLATLEQNEFRIK